MPSVSGKQHRLMAAVATNPAVARKTKIPQSVGKEFMEADKGKKFKGGGEMKESKEMVKKEIGFMKKKGAPKSMIKHEMKEAGMKPKKMASGGLATRMNTRSIAGGPSLSPRGAVTGGGKPATRMIKNGGEVKKYAAGGTVGASSMGKVVAGGKRPHGEHTVQQKGHTKAKMVKMAGGGKSRKYC